jgi:hypothetical protein
MREPGLDGRRPRDIATALALVLAGGAADAAQAAATWSVEVAPVHVEVTGHDQHVLTARQAGGGAEQVELETDAALGYRAHVLWDRASVWDYGLDFFIHRTDQGVGPLRVAAASAAERRDFEVPHRGFASTGPGQTLYFQTLEDTTVELWVADVYARRELVTRGGRSLALLVGLRNADFDNDYRAIAGLGDVGGVRIDASSNYSRMMGPVAGLSATLERGRHTWIGDLRQSVVFGDVELTRTLRDFAGPPEPFAVGPEEVPPGPASERLSTTDSITVPMTDLALAWRLRLGERWALGVSLGGTAWWDLAVPPGVVPGRADALEETTLVTYALGATLRYTF